MATRPRFSRFRTRYRTARRRFSNYRQSFSRRRRSYNSSFMTKKNKKYMFIAALALLGYVYKDKIISFYNNNLKKA